MLTQARLKELLHYNPDTGVWTWIVSKGAARSGKRAGAFSKISGYRQIAIDDKDHYEHRLAFLYLEGELPSDHTDHINRKKDDNRWQNLRRVTCQENQRNRKLQSNNTSGFQGVCWKKSEKRWVSRIIVDKKTIELGRFRDKSDAIEARKAAEIEHGFHPNHGRQQLALEAANE